VFFKSRYRLPLAILQNRKIFLVERGDRFILAVAVTTTSTRTTLTFDWNRATGLDGSGAAVWALRGLTARVRVTKRGQWRAVGPISSIVIGSGRVEATALQDRKCNDTPAESTVRQQGLPVLLQMKSRLFTGKYVQTFLQERCT
jgi:hypothetical protein